MTEEPSVAPGTLVTVRVTPNASREQVTVDGSRYVIRVTVPPEDGKANKAVTKLSGQGAADRAIAVDAGAGRIGAGQGIPGRLRIFVWFR